MATAIIEDKHLNHYHELIEMAIFYSNTEFVPSILHTTVIVSCADGRTVKAKAASDGHSHYC